MRIASMVLVIALLAGCTRDLYIKCKGEGKTTIVGGPYAGSIESKCGDLYEYEIRRQK